MQISLLIYHFSPIRFKKKKNPPVKQASYNFGHNQPVVNVSRQRIRWHGHTVHAKSPNIHQFRPQLIHIHSTNESHSNLELVLEQLHSADHTRFTLRIHSVQERSADADALRAETEGLNDVGCAPDATVSVDFYTIADIATAQFWHDFR